MSSIKLHWLENRSKGGYVTFGVPWKKGEVTKETVFSVSFTLRSETHCMYLAVPLSSFCTYGTSSALITPVSSVLARTARTLLCRSASLL